MRLSLKKKFNSFNKTVKSQISLKSLYNKVNREYIGGSMKEKYIKLMEELYKVMMKKPKDKRTKEYKEWKKLQPSIGLGDTIEKIAEALGVSKQEAMEKMAEMENEQGIQHLFDASETGNIQ